VVGSDILDLREKVAIAIYEAAFDPRNEDEAKRRIPSPGWAWEKTNEQQKQFARRQADAAIRVMVSDNTKI
jgi:hypothetical protein